MYFSKFKKMPYAAVDPVWVFELNERILFYYSKVLQFMHVCSVSCYNCFFFAYHLICCAIFLVGTGPDV